MFVGRMERRRTTKGVGENCNMDAWTLRHLENWCAENGRDFDAIRTYLDGLDADELADVLTMGWERVANMVQPETVEAWPCGMVPTRY